jgi:predicted Zn-dependent protease
MKQSDWEQQKEIRVPAKLHEMDKKIKVDSYEETMEVWNATHFPVEDLRRIEHFINTHDETEMCLTVGETRMFLSIYQRILTEYGKSKTRHNFAENEWRMLLKKFQAAEKEIETLKAELSKATGKEAA